MRLFVAIDIPQDHRSRIAALVTHLTPKMPKLKWVDPAKLHLTLKFIGELPEEKLEVLSAALTSVPFPAPIEIGLRGVARFPRVLWIGVEGARALAELAVQIESAL